MTLQIVWTREARDVLKDIVLDIRAERPLAARKFLASVHQKIGRLADFPFHGRKLPEHPKLPYREVLVGHYRMIYRPEESFVQIITFWYDRRLLTFFD